MFLVSCHCYHHEYYYSRRKNGNRFSHWLHCIFVLSSEIQDTGLGKVGPTNQKVIPMNCAYVKSILYAGRPYSWSTNSIKAQKKTKRQPHGNKISNIRWPTHSKIFRWYAQNVKHNGIIAFALCLTHSQLILQPHNAHTYTQLRPTFHTHSQGWGLRWTSAKSKHWKIILSRRSEIPWHFPDNVWHSCPC